MPLNEYDQNGWTEVTDSTVEPNEADTSGLDSNGWTEVVDKAEPGIKPKSSTGVIARELGRFPGNMAKFAIGLTQRAKGASVADRGFLDRWYDKKEDENAAIIRGLEEGGGKFAPGVSDADLAGAVQSFPHTIAGIAGGLTGAAVTSPVPVPGARVLGGLGGAYLMTHGASEYAAMNRNLKKYNEINLQETGQPITLEQENAYKELYGTDINEIANWNSGVEALSAMSEIAIYQLGGKYLPAPMRQKASKLVISLVKNKLLRAGVGNTAKLAGTLVTEIAEEVVSGIGGGNVEAEMWGEEKRDWDTSTIIEEAKAVAPQVAVTAGLVHGAGTVAGKLTRKKEAPEPQDFTTQVTTLSEELKKSKDVPADLSTIVGLRSQLSNDPEKQVAIDSVITQAVDRGIKDGTLKPDKLSEIANQLPEDDLLRSIFEVEKVEPKEVEPVKEETKAEPIKPEEPKVDIEVKAETPVEPIEDKKPLTDAEQRQETIDATDLDDFKNRRISDVFRERSGQKTSTTKKEKKDEATSKDQMGMGGIPETPVGVPDKIGAETAAPKDKLEVEADEKREAPWRELRDEYIERYIQEQRAAGFPERMITDGYRAAISREHFASVSKAYAEGEKLPDDVLAESGLGEPESKLEVAKPEQIKNVETKEIPLDQIKHSKDLPQFKEDADEKGVVEALSGKYERVGTPPIVLWERKNGDLEIITGRHRLDLAQKQGEVTIPSQVLREADGFTAEQAAIFDVESNIRDEKGSVRDYATFFRSARITEKQASGRGLLSRAKGQSGFVIGKDAGDDLYSAYRNKAVNGKKAVAIVKAAPGNNDLQNVGMRYADKHTANEVKNYLQAVKNIKSTATGKQASLFGEDESWQIEADKMATTVTDMEKEAKQELAVLKSAGKLNKEKHKEFLEKYGINPGDTKAIAEKVKSLGGEIHKLNNWAAYPDIVADVKKRAGIVDKVVDKVDVKPEAPKGKPKPKEAVPAKPIASDLVVKTKGFPASAVKTAATGLKANPENAASILKTLDNSQLESNENAQEALARIDEEIMKLQKVLDCL